MIKNFILTAALLLTMVLAQAQMVLEYDGIEASDVITLPLAGNSKRNNKLGRWYINRGS